MRPLRRILAIATAFAATFAVHADDTPWPAGADAQRVPEFRFSHNRETGGWAALDQATQASSMRLRVDPALAGQQVRELGQVGPESLYIRAQNVPAGVLAAALADVLGGEVRRAPDGQGMMIGPVPPRQLRQVVHPVPQRVLTAIPFALRQSTTEHSEVTDDQVRAFLVRMGVELPAGSTVAIQPADGQLAVVTTPYGHQQIHELLRLLGVDAAAPPQEAMPAEVTWVPGRAQAEAWVITVRGEPGAAHALVVGRLAKAGSQAEFLQAMKRDGLLTLLEAQRLDLETGVISHARRASDGGAPIRESELTARRMRVVRAGDTPMARFDIAWRGQIPLAAGTSRPETITAVDLQTTLDLAVDRPVIAATVAVPIDGITDTGDSQTIFLVLWLHELDAAGEVPATQATEATEAIGGIAPPPAPVSPYTPIHAPSYQNGKTLQEMLDILGTQLTGHGDATRPDSYIYIGQVEFSDRAWAGDGTDNKVTSIREGWQLHALRLGNTVVLMDPVVAVEPLQTAVLDIDKTDRRATLQQVARYRLPGVQIYPLTGAGKLILRAPAAILAELDLPEYADPQNHVHEPGLAPSIVAEPGSRAYISYVMVVTDPQVLDALNRGDERALSRLERSRSGEGPGERGRAFQLLGIHGFAASPAATAPRLDVTTAYLLDGGRLQARRVAATRLIVDGEPGVYTTKYAQVVESLPVTLTDGRIVTSTDGSRILGQNVATTPVTADTPPWVTPYYTDGQSDAVKLVLIVEPDASAQGIIANARHTRAPGRPRWRRDGDTTPRTDRRPDDRQPAPAPSTTPDWY